MNRHVTSKPLIGNLVMRPLAKLYFYLYLIFMVGTFLLSAFLVLTVFESTIFFFFLIVTISVFYLLLEGKALNFFIVLFVLIIFLSNTYFGIWHYYEDLRYVFWSMLLFFMPYIIFIPYSYWFNKKEQKESR